MLILDAYQAVNTLYRSTSGTRVQPRLLTDGRYAVSENTKTDPAHAAVAAILNAGAIETPASTAYTSYGEFTLQLGDRVSRLANAKVPRALSSPAPGVLRFELQRNDFGHIDDATINGNRRSELVGLDEYADGSELWQSWTLVIGPQNTGFFGASDHGTIMQMHSVDTYATRGRTPVVTFDVTNGQMQLITRSSAEISPDSESGVQKLRYAGTIPSPSTPVNIVLHMKFGQAGHLDAWINGTSVYSADIPIGYYSDIASGGAAFTLGIPHFGLYEQNIAQVDVIYLANLEWGPTSLLSRVTSPLAVPAVAW